MRSRPAAGHVKPSTVRRGRAAGAGRKLGGAAGRRPASPVDLRMSRYANAQAADPQASGATCAPGPLLPDRHPSAIKENQQPARVRRTPRNPAAASPPWAPCDLRALAAQAKGTESPIGRAHTWSKIPFCQGSGGSTWSKIPFCQGNDAAITAPTRRGGFSELGFCRTRTQRGADASRPYPDKTEFLTSRTPIHPDKMEFLTSRRGARERRMWLRTQGADGLGA